jgi:hypothetical protein
MLFFLLLAIKFFTDFKNDIDYLKSFYLLFFVKFSFLKKVKAFELN